MPEATPSPFPCDLLVFDLDGTLIDSQEDLAGSVNASLAHLRRRTLSQEQICGFIGDGASVLLSRALEATGGSDSTTLETAMAFFLRYYREHLLDTTHLYPGVVTALENIRALLPNLPMAILTNKPVNPSRAICHGLGLERFFFANYGGNSFATKKPDPLGLLTIQREAASLVGRHVDAARTVLIGDSHVDVQTARAAGVLCVGCSYGLDPLGLRAAQPDAMADTPLDWLPALQSLLANSA